MTVMALVAIACSREEQPASDGNTPFASGQDMMTIIACTESSDTTKTALLGDDANGYDVVWSEGDEIKIGSETFTLASGAGTTRGTFTGPALSDGSYQAYYATSNGKVPMTQYYTAGKITNAPMHASVTVTGGEASIANFTNIGGLLHLTIKEVKPATIKSIGLLGKLGASDINIVFDCSSSPVALTEAGSEFYIAMPEGTYTTFSVEMNTTAGGTMTKTSNKSLVINRSQITNASFKTNTLNKHEFVNLGLPSGLLWATCNIGAGSPDEVGTYFAWGETSGKSGDMIFNWENYSFGKMEELTKYNKVDGLTTLEAEDDAASYQWKEGWRIPTATEYQELIENCYWEWNYQSISGYPLPDGWIVYKAKNDEDKGKKCDSNGDGKINGYSLSDTHIFFPLSGHFKIGGIADLGDCYYWTSSLTEYVASACTFAAYHLGISIETRAGGHCYRCYGLPVRAVCE